MSDVSDETVSDSVEWGIGSSSEVSMMEGGVCEGNQSRLIDGTSDNGEGLLPSERSVCGLSIVF